MFLTSFSSPKTYQKSDLELNEDATLATFHKTRLYNVFPGVDKTFQLLSLSILADFMYTLTSIVHSM